LFALCSVMTDHPLKIVCAGEIYQALFESEADAREAFVAAAAGSGNAPVPA